MTAPAIEIAGLAKCYHIYDAPSDRLKQMVAGGAARLLRLGEPRRRYREFWALRDLTLDIRRGETFGIIGTNGSGKSTLLQLVCGTLHPTHGGLTANGRIAALLELGAGFDPEFTGRENVYTNGALLGLSPAQVEANFAEIERFADIGDFIDQPVKTYSSGMFVRLAFAVAAHLDPDILVIDEALAVGDIAFQAKCMARLRHLKDRGTTILFVSHDLASVRNLCERVLWLKNGQCMAVGTAKEVVDAFVRDLHMKINDTVGASPEPDPETAPEAAAAPDTLPAAEAQSAQGGHALAEGHHRYGNERGRILAIALATDSGAPVSLLELHEPFTVRVTIEADADIDAPVVGYSFRDLKGNQVLGAMTSNLPGAQLPPLRRGDRLELAFRGVNRLAQGTYTLSIGFEEVVDLNRVHQFIEVVEHAIVFRSTFGADPRNIFPAMVWDEPAVSHTVRRSTATA